MRFCVVRSKLRDVRFEDIRLTYREFPQLNRGHVPVDGDNGRRIRDQRKSPRVVGFCSGWVSDDLVAVAGSPFTAVPARTLNVHIDRPY